jgi:protein-L-isoaspartate(D-aspartate) O-methyltransferase
MTAQQLTGLRVKRGDKILELKTASGYQAAVLEKMGATVYTVETDVELASRIRAMLSHLKTRKVHLGLAYDCYHGWPEKGPFDGIIATAAYPAIPRELVDQLKVGGRLVAPIGVVPDQWLTIYEKQADGTLKRVESRTAVRYTMIPRP